MPIDTSTDLLGYLRDQKYTGGDNSAGNLIGGFLKGYLSGKKEADSKIDQFNAQTEQGREGQNLAMKMLGQTGLVPSEAIEQAQLTPVQKRESRIADFANAFLGNKQRAEELFLKSKTAELQGQELRNQDAASYMEQTPILAQKLLQAQNGMDVDATGLTHPKLIKEFNATAGVIKTANKLDTLLGGIQGDAWQKPETFQQLSQFWAQNPFLNKEQSGALKNAISHVRKNIEVKDPNVNPKDVTYFEDPVTHERFTVYGKSILKSGQNPSFGGPTKFDTAETSSLFRRLENIEKDIRRGKSAAGLRYKPEDLQRLNSEKEKIQAAINTKRPGQKPLTAPQMTIQPESTGTPASVEISTQEDFEGLKPGSPFTWVYPDGRKKTGVK